MNIRYLLIIVFFSMIGTAYGAGVGLYGSSGGGQMYYQKDGYWLRYKSVSDTTVFGGGFIFDANTDGEEVFNYRLTAGYNYQLSNFPATDRVNRVLMTHIFGASIIRNDVIRVWIGPQIGSGYLWGVTQYQDISVIILPCYIKSLRFRLFNLHAGMALGINFILSRDIAIPVEGGFRFHFYTNFSKRDNGSSVPNGINIMGPEGYALVGVMYRIRKIEAQ